MAQSRNHAHRGRLVAAIFSGAMLLGLSAQAQVAPVAIKVGAENGSGYAVKRGAECIVITAQHVVKESELGEAIALFDDTGAAAPGGKIVFSDPNVDLAVVRVTPPPAFNCSGAWQDGATVQDALRTASQGSLQMQVLTLREGGLSDIVPVAYAGNSGPQKFRVRTSGKNDTIAQGQSGSVLVANGKIMGIIQTTTDGVTTVLRQDQIHALAKTFAQEQGTRIVIAPIMYEGAPVDVANAAAHAYLEQQAKLVTRDAPRDWLDPQGGLTQTGDAQYTFRGKVLVAQAEQVANSLAAGNAAGGFASGLGGKIGQLGGILSRGASAANQAGMSSQQTKVTLQLELTIVDIGSGKTATELVQTTGNYPTNGGQQAAIAQEIQKAVTQGLPNVLKKAGL